MTHQLISCDDHMDLGQLPADLWTARLPAVLRHRAPRIEERVRIEPDGSVLALSGKVEMGQGGSKSIAGRLSR